MIKLNLGCASNMFPEPWRNIDREDMSDYIQRLRLCNNFDGWPEHQVKLAQLFKAGRVTCEVGDIRRPLGYETGSVDAIYLGQIWEHLNPLYEAPKLAAECFRVLKPGGRVRITTPDLEILLAHWRDDDMAAFNKEQPEFYASASNDQKLSYLMFGACGPDSTFDHYEGHHHIWTWPELAKLLEGVGFTGVCTAREPSAAFDGVVDCGVSHSLLMEATKP